jgi:murein DD-endopeptidase MepM/ murein hydrolase activator NlpD
MGEKILPMDSASGMIGSQALDRNGSTQTSASPIVMNDGRMTETVIPASGVIPAVARSLPVGQSMLHGLPLSMPVDGFISRGFDVDQSHYGIDFAGKPGSPILAAADGSIVFAGWTYEDGFTIIVSHGEGYTTVYKHNQSILKHEGEPVKRGSLLALLGNTGRTSHGPHLHFEVWRNGIAQNPSDYLLSDQ